MKHASESHLSVLLKKKETVYSYQQQKQEVIDKKIVALCT